METIKTQNNKSDAPLAINLEEFKYKTRAVKRKHIAEALNISECYLSLILNGKKVPHRKIKEAMNKYMDGVRA